MWEIMVKILFMGIALSVMVTLQLKFAQAGFRWSKKWVVLLFCSAFPMAFSVVLLLNPPSYPLLYSLRDVFILGTFVGPFFLLAPNRIRSMYARKEELEAADRERHEP